VQNRLINITLNMANEVIEVMKNNDPNILDSVIQMEKIAQRCHLLCKRMLNTQINLYKDYMNTNLYRINGLIEEITDCQRDICKEVINSKRTNQKTIKIAKSCVSLLKVCFNCFQKFNMESILELKSQEKLLKDQLEDVMKNKIDVESNSYMKMIVDKVHHMSEEFN